MPAEPENNKTPAAPTVCIADPDEALTGRLAELLETLGPEVRAYASGQALLADLRPGTICVIAEARLPDMTGIELIGSLRDRMPGVPVILLATDGDVAAAVSAMRAGALDFIEKPHVDRLLAWRVRHLLENDGPEAGSG
jgi:two-component system response regulator FixJ